MTDPLWAAIREHIIAEVKLAVLRHNLSEHWPAYGHHALTTAIGVAEEQCTRMETEVRRLIAAASTRNAVASSPIGAFTREDAAKLVERKARSLTDEYCHGDSGPGGYTWSNKEAEWQVILLEELAEEFRRGA